MAAYKTLNSQDIVVTPLEVTKGFSFEGNNLTGSDVGIDRFIGLKSGTTTSTGYITPFSQSLIYYSTQQLYYSNYISGSNGEIQNVNTQSIQPDGTTRGLIDSNAFFNFNSTDLNPEKYWPTGSDQQIAVLSILKALFGDYILPKSLNIITDSGSYFDNGEGVVQRENDSGEIINVGNIVYEHGMVILTGGNVREDFDDNLYGTGSYGAGFYGGGINTSSIDNFTETTNITCSFSSSFTIYESQYKCTIAENEFNYSLNPSVISGSSNDGTVFNFVTSSYFSPYVTTVGLYNNEQELLAVGKLAQPLPTSRNTDTTILVNIDRQ